MSIQITRVNHLSHFITFFFACFFLTSCYQEESKDILILEEGRCQFGATDGIAEINGINRWLRIGNVGVGCGDTTKIYDFTVGGFRPDCSLYEEINLTLILDRYRPVDGIYKIIRNNIGNQPPGTAKGELTTRLDGSSTREKTELYDGNVTIREIGFLRFEIEVEANNNAFNPITLKYTNPPRP